MKTIMFNDKYGLTASVLAETKTQTRRIISNKLLSKYGYNKYNDRSDDLIRDARYKVGEVVAVAQCYEDAILDVGEEKWNKRHKWYNINYLCHEKGLHNKMFVRADLMPHRIRIEKVRVERLQDISDEDCLEEGIDIGIDDNGRTIWKYYDSYYFDSPKDAYAALIDKISGKGTWERNPWVFAYTFSLSNSDSNKEV